MPFSVDGVEVSAKSWLTGESTFDGSTAVGGFRVSRADSVTDAAVDPLLFVRVSEAGLPLRLIPRAARIAASSSNDSFRAGDLRSTTGSVGESFVRGLDVADDPSAFVPS